MFRTFLLTIVALILAIPLIILFPLGIYLGNRWALSLNSVVVEGDGPIQSLRRSWHLTRRAWWHTFGALFVSALIVGIASSVVGALFGGVGGVLTVTGSAAIGGVFTILGSALATIFVQPFSAAISVVLYYELRARQEGFDLQSQARQQWPSS